MNGVSIASAGQGGHPLAAQIARFQCRDGGNRKAPCTCSCTVIGTIPGDQCGSGGKPIPPGSAPVDAGGRTTPKDTGGTTVVDTGATKQCTSGPCCNTSAGTYLNKTTKCGSSVKKNESKCVGNNVHARQAFTGCSGTSSVCGDTGSAAWYWTDWKLSKSCGSKKCKTNGGTAASCFDTTPKQCTSGSCCDVSKGTYKSKWSKCGSSVVKTESKCYSSSTFANKINGRKAYYGCTGSSSSCSKSSTYYYWTSWGTIKTCSTNYKCVYSGGKGVCKPASQCSSGVCCYLSSGKFKPAKTKCGTIKLTSDAYGCSGDQKVTKKDLYYGCSGTSSKCSYATKYKYATSTYIYKTCPSKQYCTATNKSKPLCSDRKADLIPTVIKMGVWGDAPDVSLCLNKNPNTGKSKSSGHKVMAENIGKLSAGKFTVAVGLKRLSNGKVYKCSKTLSSTGLKVNYEQTWSKAWCCNVGGKPPKSKYGIWVKVDAGGTVGELSGANNEKTVGSYSL